VNWFHFFSFFLRSGSCRILYCFFLLLLRSKARIHACSALPPVACSRWIAGSTTQWWRFVRISESCSNLHEFVLCLMLVIEFNGEFCCFWREIDLNWCWIWSRVCVFLSFLWTLVNLICNCQERENGFCLWCGVILILILTPRAFYSMPCGLWTNGELPRRPGSACVAIWTELAYFDLEDQSANM